MARLIITISLLILTSVAFAQSFPDAQKQPRQKEMKGQHRKFRRAAHRRHIRRGTAYIEFNNSPFSQWPACILVDNRSIFIMALT